MRRFLYIMIAVLFVPAVRAQEKYNVVLEQSKQVSPYEAIYMLMEYQYWRPELPGVYYELGNLCYSLLPTRDPLHHYDELNTLLYQSRLFYGNCLHFAKEQKLPGWQYEEIAQGQKKIEYDQLVRYIRPRMREVQRQQQACDSIHNTFVRMAERYNQCQSMFTAFLTRYTREKTAHLQLLPEERTLLKRLQQSADSLEMDIAAYQQALALQPVKGYQPVFRKEEIALYRLDGLTHTDFLQNDIALWDYSRWVQHFLDEQAEVYERLYTDVEKEYRQLLSQQSAYKSGRTISGHIDESLTGRCARLGLQTPKTDSVAALQTFVRHGAAEQMIAKSNPPQSIREFMPTLLIAAENNSAVRDSAQQLMMEHVIKTAEPLRIMQQPVYTHPVSGETISYKPEAGESVHVLLPDDMLYRCVLSSEQGTRVMVLSREMEPLRTVIMVEQEQPLVFTKLTGNRWALVTDKNVYFME